MRLHGVTSDTINMANLTLKLCLFTTVYVLERLVTRSRHVHDNILPGSQVLNRASKFWSEIE